MSGDPGNYSRLGVSQPFNAFVHYYGAYAQDDFRLNAKTTINFGIRLEHEHIETNILYFDIAETGVTAEALVHALKAAGVGMGAFGTHRIRAVTHLGVTAADIEAGLAIFRATLSSLVMKRAG